MQHRLELGIGMSALGLNGSMVNGSGARLAPAALARLQEEQIAFVLRYTPGTMIATVCNGAICSLALWQTVGARPAALWALSLCMAVAISCRRGFQIWPRA